MSFVSDFIGDITGAGDQADAATYAADTQSQAAVAGINEQRRQFDSLVELMSPYVTAGTGALAEQQAIVGLSGEQEQQDAISGFEQSPLFQSLTQQGESAILQNAAATGGLRGGDIQGALSQYRPQLLNQLVEQQYGRLAGITNVGQASAAQQASSGLQTGTNVANLLAQQGAATAGGQIAQGQVGAQGFSNLLGIGGVASGFF